MLVAVITATDIQGEVDIHFPSFVDAKRTIDINAVCLTPSYPQMEQLSHIHDVEREILRMCHKPHPLITLAVEITSARFFH